MKIERKENILLIISGPTAVGKTDLCLELATTFNKEIVSADSRQVYKYMNIGTAKPNHLELQRVQHHLVDYLELDQKISAGDWSRSAHMIIEGLAEKGSLPIVTGGTLFYIKSLVEGLDDFPAIPNDIVLSLNQEHQAKGIQPLQYELEDKDPQYFQVVDKYNPERLIRALSVIRHTGRSFSSFQTVKREGMPWRALKIALLRDRNELYPRINQRTDRMMQQGLLAEVESLRSYKDLQSMQTVGYKELLQYFDKEHSLDKAVELIKRNSRRYAKRQITWLRNESRWHYFHPDDKDEIVSFISQELEKVN